MTVRPTTAVRLPAMLIAAVAMAGCSQFGDPLEAIGARPPAPDEFMVVERDPLVVPPQVQGGGDVALPRPAPGTPSPRNPDPRAEAAEALLGGAPAGAVSQPSPGESALVSVATAEADPEVRQALEAQAAAAAEAEANAPYEPPTIFELFGGDPGDETDPETLVDPVAESQRLQRQGVRAPTDPEATAAPEEGGGG
ncbi:MAG: DUF3035 domain-containing protein [Pseudomonadota bacterium]